MSTLALFPSDRQQKLASNSIFISCVVPVYNEGAIIDQFIPKLVEELQKHANLYEIIVVDDGSLDDTLERITALHRQNDSIKFLSLSRNFGKEIAITAGLDNTSGDVTIILDADFQHPLSLIAQFLQEWSAGFDMVYGLRKNRESESTLKRAASRLFYALMQSWTKMDIENGAGDFRLLDQTLVKVIQSFPERTRFMKGLYNFIGFKKKSVLFEVPLRTEGKSHFGFRKLTDLAITGLTSFSDIPLRVWSLVGACVSLIAFCYAIYIITRTLLFGTDLPGFPSIIVAIMFLGGIQLLSIGILGEYIARIFTEVKHRPMYIVKYKRGLH